MLFWLLLPVVLVAVSYACGPVIMYRHVERQQWSSPREKFLWEVLAVVPFSVFFYFARKPWTASATLVVR